MHILRQPLWVLFCLQLLPGAGLLLPFNIFSAYYFQSILKTKAAFIVSVGRGLVISGAFILLLTLCFGGSSVWLPMPRTELVTALCAAALMHNYTAAG